MSVVRAMEALGSRSGETQDDIMIADCGVIASARGFGKGNSTRGIRSTG